MRRYATTAALTAALLSWLGVASAERVRWDFEDDSTEWVACDVDPNTASVSVTTEQAARGGRSLAVTGTFPGSAGTSYFPWRDWRPYGTLRFQVHVPDDAPEDLDVYVYLKDKQYLWYQTAPFRAPDTGGAGLELKRGQWNDVKVDISPDSRVWRPGGHLKSWHRALYYPREFGIRFFSDSEWSGALLVDDVRLVGLRPGQKKASRWDGDEPALHLRRNADAVPCYEKLELTFYLDGEPENPFDPEVIDVMGHFRAPSGATVDVPGFYYQDFVRMRDSMNNEKVSPVGEPCWKIRFSPTEPGEHDYYVTVREARGQLRSATEVFTAKPATDPRGRVRVSKTDPRYFEFENGEFFYPQGINMRDGGDQAAKQKGTYEFDRFFPVFSAAGLQFVRTWMCAWWAGIEWTDKYDSRYDGLGRYSMLNAWRLDHAVELAEANDLFIELTFNSHGQLRRDKFDAEWEYNPYSAANGGPVVVPSVFWTNPQAKAAYRNRYRYIAARWGHSQHIMSWDLWNEIDLVDAYGQLQPDVAQWHRELTGYLRDIDPQDHLITTHFCLFWSWDNGNSLWTLPNIDYVQADAYWPDKHIADNMSTGYGLRAGIEKPYIVIEFGPQTAGIGGLTPAQVESFYRIGLWGSAVMPMATPAQFWYHDRWMRYNYARHNAALAKFTAGEDHRGKGWQWIDHNPKQNPTYPRVAPANLFVHAMKSPKATYFYAFDVERINGGDATRKLAPYQGAVASLQGIPDGAYACEFWEPYLGEVIANADVTVADGVANVALPDFTQDVACKMRLKG